MPTTHHPRRIDEVDELLQLQYERYHEFRRQITFSSGNERISLKQQLKHDVVPALRALEREYAQILSITVNDADLPEHEASVIIAEVVDASLVQRVHNAPQPMLTLLHEIRDKLNEPGKSAAAKLKVSLPIIPMLASYELELDTEGALTQVWRKVKDFFERAASSHPQ